MNIRFDVPPYIEERISINGSDPNAKARVAFLVELYREDAITHGQLAEALGIDAYEADGVLKKHGVALEITAEELRDEALSLAEASRECLK